MRSGKWIIASCGIVGLVLGHAAASDRFYGQNRFTFEGRSPSHAPANTFFSRPKPAESAEADDAASDEPAAENADTPQNAAQKAESPSRPATAAPAKAKKAAPAGKSNSTSNFSENLKGAKGAVRTASAESSELKRSPVVQAGFEDEAVSTEVRTENGRRVIKDSQFMHAEFDRNTGDSERNHIQQLSGEAVQQMGGFFETPQKSAMIHADHQQKNGDSERDQIQQLSGRELAPKPAGSASRFQLTPAAPREREPERKQGSADRGNIEQAGGLIRNESKKSAMIHAEHLRNDGDSERDQFQQVRGSSQASPAPQRRTTAAAPLKNAQYERSRTAKKRTNIRMTQADARDAELSESDLDQLEIPELPRLEESTDVPAPPALSPPPSASRIVPMPSSSSASRMEPIIASATTAHSAGHGDSQTPHVTVQWIKKSDINVGQECQCELLVKNNGQINARDIAVDAYFPASVRLTAADPQPSESADHLSWAIKELAAGEEQTIRLTMIPSKRGELATTALVRFTGAASNVFQVEEPLLAVTAKGPKEVMVGDPASQEVTVTNPGSGVAHNVAIEAIVPAGLEHARGQKLVMDVGSVGPGESRTVRLALAAVSGGEHAVQIHARAEGDLEQEFTSYVTVIAPSLKVGIDGPSLRYVGRNAVYALTVLNDGRADSNNVRVMHKVPDGFKFVRADKGGKFDESNHTITWFVGHLAAGERTELKTELAATQMGDFLHAVGAVSENGARSESELETHVDGSASLVLEIVDLDDPVEVGVETGYEVHVRNDGSIPAQNVGISCELPGGVEFLGAKGPSEHRAENGLVVFRGLAQLDPGKTAVYKITVRGQVEGNQRVRARLASDSIKEPLIFEELTKFYGE